MKHSGKVLFEIFAALIIAAVTTASGNAQPTAQSTSSAVLRSEAPPPPPRPGLDFSSLNKPQSPSDEALTRYGELTDTTILRAPGLPVLSASLTANLPADTTEAIATLKTALLAEGIEIIPHRDLFTLAVRPGWSNTPPAAQLERIPAEGIGRQPAPASSPQVTQEIIAPGMIDFINADGNQVLQLYCELVNKTLLRSGNLGHFQIKLRTQTAISKSAAIYALRAMLALHGFALIEDGDKFEEIMPIAEAGAFTQRAPRPAPGEETIALDRIRQFRASTGAELVDYYAELTGQTATQGPDPNPRRIRFRAQTPLTKLELCYALETTLKLNGLAIKQADNKTIQLIRK